MTKIAINGFGRIGRTALKIALEKPGVEVVAVNDLSDPEILAYLLKYDTAYGVYEKDVSHDGNCLIVGGSRVQILCEKEPEKLPWQDLGVDVVLECTGRFTKDGKAIAHINAGAKKVVVSAPVKGEGGVQMFIRGVNDNQYIGQNVISAASCTTNCISPVVALIHSKFKVLKSVLTTIHAVTNTQFVVDSMLPSGDDDFRRARSAGYNLIPTTTGAAKATTQIIPDLKGLFDGIAVRVPVVTGSLSDITMLVEKKTSVEEINKTFLEAKEAPPYKGVLDATYEPIVSSDIIKNPFSSIVDLEMTKVVDGDLVKVLAWYDNEWGYTERLVELALMASS